MKKFSELRKQVRANPERAARVQAHKASLLARLSLYEAKNKHSDFENKTGQR